MKGAEIVIDSLRKEGVKVIFGYPGGAVIPIFDELYEVEDIRFVLARHEQGAVHAADGYARSTGKVGVCIVTSGPGATNTITGIATAKMDSVPLVVISGQVKRELIGSDAFQETDMVGLTRPITKHNYLVQRIEELPVIMKEAFYIARSGRPGPVSVDIPVDITLSDIKEYDYPSEVNLPGYKPVYEGNVKQIRKVAEEIKKAERPLLYIGGGVIISGGCKEIRELAKIANIPVVSTLMGLGCFDSTHELFLGMPGMHGTCAANHALIECDLLIAVGVRFDDRVTGNLKAFAKDAKIIHIDIDPAEISKNVKAHVPVVGDAKRVLSKLLEYVEPRRKNWWNDTVSSWKKRYPLSYDHKDADGIPPQYVIDLLNEVAPEDSIIVTDVGQHQMWAAQLYRYRYPRTLLTSGGLGTMGYGFPAAIGAAIGNPDKTVIVISGDGSIQMNIQEFATAHLNDVNVKVLIMNNAYLGMVRQWQDLFWNKRYAATCLKRRDGCPPKCDGSEVSCPEYYCPDFVKLAESYFIKGYRVRKTEEVKPILEKIMSYKGPAVVEFVVRREENVFPMVPAGKSLDEMLLGS